MDLFEHRYYKLNKRLASILGHWPEQSIRVRYVMSVVLLSLGTTVAAPMAIGILHNISNWDILIEGGMGLFFAIFCVAKLISSTFYSEKILILLKHIRTDWETWSHDCDGHILHEYTQKGRKMTIVYSDLSMLGPVMCFTTCTLYILQPVLPKIIDFLLMNGTERGQFPVPLDYCYIDMQKYYFYIMLHIFVCISLAFLGSMSYDCWFMVFVQHGCGLFAVLGRKLQRIRKNEKSMKSREITHTSDKPDGDLVYLGSCINKHREAIEYADLIESIYSRCFFVVLGINILLISISGLQIVTKTVDRQQIIRFIFINVLSVMHLYVNNYMAQILMDHSISIRYYILNGEWYELPLKTQKILLLMLMRCNVPCKLTAGKISILSIETFAMYMKTSLSYFTVLRSM